MTPDARNILNMKKRRGGFRNFTTANQKITMDARQILRQKRFGLSTRSDSRPNFKLNQYNTRSIPLARTQLNQMLQQQQVQNTVRRNRWNVNTMPQSQLSGLNKTVKFQPSGILTITSSRNRGNDSVALPTNKVVRTVPNGIMVTTRNKAIQQKVINNNDDRDELEKMTIDDIPDIQSAPHELFSKKKQGSSLLTSNILSGPLVPAENTMIADMVASPVPSNSSWKVFVTGLRVSVTEEDIIELFGDIGALKTAQLIQPGIAVVEYYSKADALQACDTYDNRLLDGQPMHCGMQLTSGRASVASRLGEKFQPVPTTFSLPRQTASSLFMSSASKPSSSFTSTKRGNHNVAFMVKLP